MKIKLFFPGVAIVVIGLCLALVPTLPSELFVITILVGAIMVGLHMATHNDVPLNLPSFAKPTVQKQPVTQKIVLLPADERSSDIKDAPIPQADNSDTAKVDHKAQIKSLLDGMSVKEIAAFTIDNDLQDRVFEQSKAKKLTAKNLYDISREDLINILTNLEL